MTDLEKAARQALEALAAVVWSLSIYVLLKIYGLAFI